MTSNKVAIVSSGDSSTGSIAARYLASEGYKVAILSSSGKGQALASELGGIGVIESRRSAATVQELMDLAIGRWGRVDVLVNSAENGPMLDVGDDDLHTAMDAYLMDIVRPTRIVAPVMARQGGGSVVNISTIAAFEPDPRFPTSGIFRSALSNFSKLFDGRYAADNVRMNTVFPFVADGLNETEDRCPGIPLASHGKVGEISSLIAYLASEASAHVTGQTLCFDGGLSAPLNAMTPSSTVQPLPSSSRTDGSQPQMPSAPRWPVSSDWSRTNMPATSFG